MTISNPLAVQVLILADMSMINELNISNVKPGMYLLKLDNKIFKLIKS